MADFDERRETHPTQRRRSSRLQLQGAPVMDDALLDEVTALVEWPVPLAGTFEQRFLQLPREVLISTLQDHQRYFPSAAQQTARCCALFIAVSNIESRDPDQVRAGNERVVRPAPGGRGIFLGHRPQAAARVPHALRSPRSRIQTRLGSLQDKVTRTEGARCADRSDAIGADPRSTERAAELCKCDLLTAMVGEFPELQGTMGRYYAQHDGEQPEVATAIAEHYLPRFAGDELPGHTGRNGARHRGQARYDHWHLRDRSEANRNA